MIKKSIDLIIDEDIFFPKELSNNLKEIKRIPKKKISSNILRNVNALIIKSNTSVNSKLLSNSSVRFVGSVTSGIDHVDTDWLKKKKIRFSFSPGCNSIAVVEYVFSVLLTLSIHNKFYLRDKVIGIVGFGNIGSLLYQRLNDLGIQTMLYDPLLEKKTGEIRNWSSLDKLVSQSDILTFHVPLTKNGKYPTWHLVEKEMIESISGDKIIINTSRGEVIDSVALLKELKNGKKLKVVLDVWEFEPNISYSLLSHVDLGSAHIAGHTIEGKIRGAVKIFKDYHSFLGKNFFFNSDSLIQSLRKFPIRMKKKFDERALYLLSRTVYDIKMDDQNLRNMISIPNGFEIIRKNYFMRREWSSISVETNSSVDEETLFSLGFHIP